MRLARYSAIFLVTFLLAGCWEATNPAYHEKREAIIATEAFTVEKVCAELFQNNCEENIEKYIQEAIKQVMEALPSVYFKNSGASGPSKLIDNAKASVYVTVLPPAGGGGSKKAGTKFTLLSDRAQQKLVEKSFDYVLNKKGDGPFKKRVAEIYDAIGHTEPKKPVNPFTRNHRIRLNISSAFNAINPADRMERIFTFVFLLNDQGRFVDVELLKPEIDKIVYGNIGVSSKAGVGLNLSDFVSSIGGKKGKTGVTASSAVSRTLARQLSKRYAQRNISITPDNRMLVVRQVGQEDIDPAGNVTTHATVSAENRPVTIGLYEAVPDKLSKIGISGIKRRPFNNSGNIDALVLWVTQSRIVNGTGKNTVLESDDVVTPIVLSGMHKVALWQNTQKMALLAIQIPDANHGQKNNGDKKPESCSLAFLTYKYNGRSSYLSFKGHEDADKFLAHLQTRIHELSDAKSDSPSSLKMGKDLEMGFTLNVDGSVDKTYKMVNINIPDHIRKDPFVYLMDPPDYPIKNPVWSGRKDCE